MKFYIFKVLKMYFFKQSKPDLSVFRTDDAYWKCVFWYDDCELELFVHRHTAHTWRKR